MSWRVNSDRPIYLQLVEQLVNKIVSGEYRAGEKLPSVRELASEASVNPNTMQRALAELEGRGLVCTQRTAGRTITTDVEIINTQRAQLAAAHGTAYLLAAKSLGMSHSDAVQLIQSMIAT